MLVGVEHVKITLKPFANDMTLPDTPKTLLDTSLTLLNTLKDRYIPLIIY